jgi:hypothetical protein
MSHALRMALEETGLPLRDVTVLAQQNDPFRQDTPAGRRDGAWLADTLEKLGIDEPRHCRGLHYALIGQIKPDGKGYTSSDADWQWLSGDALKAARWLGYIPWDRIVDERNAPPITRLWRPPVVETEITGLVPQPKVLDEVRLLPGLTNGDGEQFEADGKNQNYHLVFFGEKSSLEPILSELADRCHADVYIPSGELSDTQLYQMAKSGAKDPRPMIVFCVSDADPSGWQMPISISRKLQAFKTSLFPDLDFQVRRAGMTPEQVKTLLTQGLDLPSSPLKEGEKRAGAWWDAFGIEQIEVDAIITLYPDELRELIVEAIAPFFDDTLEERTADAVEEWETAAQEAIDGHVPPSALATLTERLATLREHIESEVDAINSGIRTLIGGEIRLPKFETPDAEDNSEDVPDPLVDSQWEFADQCERLIASKQYRPESLY